jgi:hypothetical protein
LTAVKLRRNTGISIWNSHDFSSELSDSIHGYFLLNLKSEFSQELFMALERVRTNVDMALAVRNGVVIDVELGVICAWLYMSSNGVAESTMLRVLLDSGARRQADEVALRIAKKARLTDRKPEVTQAVFGSVLGEDDTSLSWTFDVASL